MDNRTRQAVLAGRRAQLFLTARAAEIGTAVTPSLRKRLDTAVARLRAFEDQQLGSTKTALGETTALKQMRKDIYEDFLVMIRRTAAAENLNDPLLIIDSRIDVHSEFLARLDSLVAALPRHESAMIPAVGPEFIGRLKTAIDELKAATNSRERHWGSRSGATKGLEAANRAVRETLRQIDGMIMGWLKGDPSLKADLIADWKASSKIHRTRIEPRRGGSVELPDNEENPT